MTPTPLEFRTARAADVPPVIEILREASLWLRSRGLPSGWPVPYPADILLRHVARSELYVVDRGPEIAIATVTLQWEDVPFWGERPPDGCYLHHFAVRRSVAGQRVGEQVVAWAERVARGRGRAFLRLDCLADDPVLIRYYERLGFERRGETTVGSLRMALLEKRLAGV